MESCLYEGRVHHQRVRPVKHAFAMPLSMVYLDLAELDRAFRGRWLWSTHRPALARFRREDHLGDPRAPLDRAVRDLVAERTGRRPEGPVRLLTHLRTFGYVFNPVSLYYCFDADGGGVEALVAEVTNTPWNERHCYVLPRTDARRAVATPGGRTLHFETGKDFHVSPFMGMDMRYRWRVREPDRWLSVRIENHDAGGSGPLFRATLALRRREITGPALARMLLRYPAMPVRVAANIYWQALRLHRKGVPHHPHPRASGERLETAT